MIVETMFGIAFVLMAISIELRDPSYSFVSFGLSQVFIGFGFIFTGQFYLGVFQILIFVGLTVVMLFVTKMVVIDEV